MVLFFKRYPYQLQSAPLLTEKRVWNWNGRLEGSMEWSRHHAIIPSFYMTEEKNMTLFN